MASINPISTSIKMTLNLGVVDGKQVEKSISINNLDNEVLPQTKKGLIAYTASKSLLNLYIFDFKSTK